MCRRLGLSFQGCVSFIDTPNFMSVASSKLPQVGTSTQTPRRHKNPHEIGLHVEPQQRKGSFAAP